MFHAKRDEALCSCCTEPTNSWWWYCFHLLFFFCKLTLLLGIDARPGESLDDLLELLGSRLQVFTQSIHLEVQERACFTLELVQLVSADPSLAVEIAMMFNEPLNPVHKEAQKKVPVPQGLDLDQQINEVPDDSDSDEYFTDDEEEGDGRSRK